MLVLYVEYYYKISFFLWYSSNALYSEVKLRVFHVTVIASRERCVNIVFFRVIGLTMKF